MYVIGLTGGIASGKSLVSSILAELGAVVLDVDKVGHEIIKPNEPAYREIVEYFGRDILMDNGKIDRKKLGKMVFSDPKKLKVLNRITHYRIRERVREILEKYKNDGVTVVVVEAALLFEMEMHEMVDEVWVVWANKKQQIERLIKRDGLTEEEAEKRIAAQLPPEQKVLRADRVIYNSGDVEDTKRQVAALWHELSLKLLKKR
ncbi:MAG: Dephospho-CoA kinase [Clostridia bacterium 41_269]|nr:MAG: Dephospho-CoA kinase [Clostridia bacterium 41_269]